MPLFAVNAELAAVTVIVLAGLLPIVADVGLALAFGIRYTISDTIRRLGFGWLGTWVVLNSGLWAGLLLGHFYLCPSPCPGGDCHTVQLPSGDSFDVLVRRFHGQLEGWNDVRGQWQPYQGPFLPQP